MRVQTLYTSSHTLTRDWDINRNHTYYYYCIKTHLFFTTHPFGQLFLLLFSSKSLLHKTQWFPKNTHTFRDTG